MATEIRTTSVTVSFSTDNAEELGKNNLVWETDDTRVPQSDEEVYLRLYPGIPEHLVLTSGSIAAKGSDYADVEEVLVFSGSDGDEPITSVSLRYPTSANLVIERLGSFYGPDGESINVELDYDSDEQIITADKSCYGAIRVTYEASYESYLFKFAGDPCTIDYIGGRIEATGGYTEAVIIALNPTEDASAYIQVTPEKCGDTTAVKISDDQADPVKLKLEIHKDFPIRVTGGEGTLGSARVGCKVRQIPAVPADIDLSSGNYTEEDFSGSGSTTKRDDNIWVVNNYNPQNTEQVTDAVSFSVSSSAKLNYQPHGKVKVISNGKFLNKWGNSVSPTFAQPGDEIIQVEWLTEHSYTNPVKRTVEADEIVALTHGNKTIDVRGTAKAEYTIQFRVYDVEMDVVDPTRSEDGWYNVHMLATYEGQTAYLALEAPSMKEK